MTAVTEFDGELPLLVSCLTCCSTYVVPHGPPALDDYYASTAAHWFSNHACAIPMPGLS